MILIQLLSFLKGLLIVGFHSPKKATILMRTASGKAHIILGWTMELTFTMHRENTRFSTSSLSRL